MFTLSYGQFRGFASHPCDRGAFKSWDGCGALSLCPFLGAAHTTGVTELWCPQHSLEWVMLAGSPPWVAGGQEGVWAPLNSIISPCIVSEVVAARCEPCRGRTWGQYALLFGGLTGGAQPKRCQWGLKCKKSYFVCLGETEGHPWLWHSPASRSFQAVFSFAHFLVLPLVHQLCGHRELGEGDKPLAAMCYLCP